MIDLTPSLSNPTYALIIGLILGFVLSKFARLAIIAVIGVLLLGYLGVTVIDQSIIPQAIAYALPLFERLKEFILQSQALATGVLLGFVLGSHK